jgi:hypothetical protein
MEMLGKILTDTIVTPLLKRYELTSVIEELWLAILPRHLAENCRPVMLTGGVLTVETLSPSYSYDLRCESSAILARLHQSFGNKVRKLNIVLAESP